MPMEMKLMLGLRQQLVMTPRLLQAVKLLQLSRLELSEVVREELTENPVLEDDQDSAREQEKGREEYDEDGRSDATLAAAGETEVPAPERTVDSAAEVPGDGRAVTELDWAAYLDDRSMALPMPSQRTGTEVVASLESSLTRRSSLCDHLVGQLNLAPLTEAENHLGRHIIGNLDGDGYLRDPPLAEIVADLGARPEIAEKVLRIIQRFDPVGVAARTLQECLLVQVAATGARDALVVAIIEGHLGHLGDKKYARIAMILGEPIEEVCEAGRVIRALDPRPGRRYSTDEPRYITPDVFIHKIGDKYFVVPNDDGLPRLKISSLYRTALAGPSPARRYIQDKLQAAQWLIRSIQQRQRTIIRVTESILKLQDEFFERGIEHLRPLSMREVADDIGMHESTVSRVAANKYVHTPLGIFELRFFFNTGIPRTDGDGLATAAVKSKIRGILASEDSTDPCSDRQIVGLLLGQKVDIARRTVAKYREELGVQCAAKRRRVL